MIKGNEFLTQSLLSSRSSFVATNLRLDNAQTVFPCMDEPPYKATFKLSVLRPKNMTALSNTPLESTTES